MLTYPRTGRLGQLGECVALNPWSNWWFYLIFLDREREKKTQVLHKVFQICTDVLVLSKLFVEISSDAPFCSSPSSIAASSGSLGEHMRFQIGFFCVPNDAAYLVAWLSLECLVGSIHSNFVRFWTFRVRRIRFDSQDYLLIRQFQRLQLQPNLNCFREFATDEPSKAREFAQSRTYLAGVTLFNLNTLSDTSRHLSTRSALLDLRSCAEIARALAKAWDEQQRIIIECLSKSF